MAQQTDRYSNPAFDNRIYALTGLKKPATQTGSTSADLQRGYIKQDLGWGPGPKRSDVYSARFLYNPSAVSVTHSVDGTSSPAALPQSQRNPNDTSKLNIPLQTTLAFNLLFDRSYELWDAGAPNPNPWDKTASPSKVGVVVDVEALYRVIGILSPTTALSQAQKNANSSVPPRVPNSKSVPPFNRPPLINAVLNQGGLGPMPLTPCTVYFGGANSLSYHGYINNLAIQYTHFSQLMVPIRCTVNVSMILITDSPWKT